jgi:NADH-quinone oxidoreductase subunit C
MSDPITNATQAIIERFGAESMHFRDAVSLIFPPQHIIEVCRILRDEFAFDMLEAQTAVDYWPDETPRFHVIYQVYSYQHFHRLCLRVPLNGNAPSIPSLVSIYPNANWHEREIWDMFGINFENHPDLRRILMPQDWEGHPLRKDYPLGYEEVQFTFNYDEIDLRKPYAKE